MATGFLAHWKRLFVSYLHPRSLSSTLASPFLLKVCDFVSQSLIVCVHAKSLLSCTILCNTVNCSLPDSSVHGILQARILEWVSMPSSRGSSQPRNGTQVSALQGILYCLSLQGVFLYNFICLSIIGWVFAAAGSAL